MTGEVVNFTNLTNGQSADINAPLVIYQKLRFLDEELGKLIALYDFDGEDCGCFEDLLKHRRDMGGLFCPGDKSVSFVKVSRSGTGYCTSDRLKICWNLMKNIMVIRSGSWYVMETIFISDGRMKIESGSAMITCTMNQKKKL